MTIEVFAFIHNELKYLPHFMKHYEFADKINFMDGQSDDGSLDYLSQFPNVEVIQVDSGGVIRDDIHLHYRNNVWKNSQADFVIVIDSDEAIYHSDLKNELSKPEYANIGVLRLAGYEMITREFPSYDKPIAEQVQYGNYMRELSKPVLFRPNAVTEMNYCPGGHICNPVLKEGYKFVQSWEVGEISTKDCIKILHMNKLGLEYHLDRTYKRRARLSAENVKNGWGYHHLWPDHYIKELFEKEMETRVKVV